jgi:hypothetical protein
MIFLFLCISGIDKARGPYVALATVLCGPSHDLGITQCKKGKHFASEIQG